MIKINLKDVKLSETSIVIVSFVQVHNTFSITHVFCINKLTSLWLKATSNVIFHRFTLEWKRDHRCAFHSSISFGKSNALSIKRLSIGQLGYYAL